MIHSLNDLVISTIKAEMGWQGLNQLQLATRIGKRPEWVQRRLAGTVQMTISDAEAIGTALGVSLVELRRMPAGNRRAS